MHKNYNFEVEILHSGQMGRYQDSLFHYEIKSSLSEDIVKKFAMNVLKKSFIKVDMPNAFAPEMIQFEKIDENVYRYAVKELFTD